MKCKSFFSIFFSLTHLHFSKPFALSLLFLHLGCLCLFVVKKWKHLFVERKTSTHSPAPLHPNTIVTCLFCCNFIGIVFARSLHFQFYSWYFHQLPFLLYTARDTLPLYFGVPLLLVIEVIWNIFPANPFSSLSLQVAHITLLMALYFSQNTLLTPSVSKEGKEK